MRRDQRGGTRDQKCGTNSEPRDQASQAMGSGSAVFLRDQGSGCTIFVGSRTKTCHAFGVKDQTYEYKTGIDDEKLYLVMTLGNGKCLLNSGLLEMN